MSNSSELLEHRRGTIAARTILISARHAVKMYEAELAVSSESSERDNYAILFYYSGFFIFLSSSLQAMKNSDSFRDKSLRKIQDEYFKTQIKPDELYTLIKDERDRIAHGNDELAGHPFHPESKIDRYSKNGKDWVEAIFANEWPEGKYAGKPIIDIMWMAWRQVSNWIDDIDAKHQRYYDSQK